MTLPPGPPRPARGRPPAGAHELTVAVYDRLQAEQSIALEATGGPRIAIMSADGVATSLGVGVLAAMQAQIGRPIIVDCGDAAGQVLAGLRAGLRRFVFTGSRPTLGRLRQVAAQLGGEVLDGPPTPLLRLGFGEPPAQAMRRWGAERAEPR